MGTRALDFEEWLAQSRKGAKPSMWKYHFQKTHYPKLRAYAALLENLLRFGTEQKR